MKQLEMAKWLKGLTLFTGAIGLVTLTMVIPVIMNELFSTGSNPQLSSKILNVFVWLTAVPIYLALYKIWKICTNISNNNSFCHENAKLLKEISFLAILDTILYLVTTLVGIFFIEVDIVAILLLICAVGAGIFSAVLTVALSHLTTKASML